MMMLLIRALSLLMSDMTMTTTMRMFDNIGSTLNNQEDTIVVITFFTARFMEPQNRNSFEHVLDVTYIIQHLTSDLTCHTLVLVA